MKNQLGSNLKSLRKKMGLGQEEVAKSLGIKREVLSYYENGKRKIPLIHLQKLSDLYCIELIELLETDIKSQKASVAFAFRSDKLNEVDLDQIINFRKIVKNHLKLVKRLEDER